MVQPANGEQLPRRVSVADSVRADVEAMRRAGALLPDSDGLVAMALKLARQLDEAHELTGPVAVGYRELRSTLIALRRTDGSDNDAFAELLNELSAPVRDRPEPE